MMVTVIVFPGTSMIAPLDMDIQVDNSLQGNELTSILLNTLPSRKTGMRLFRRTKKSSHMNNFQFLN